MDLCVLRTLYSCLFNMSQYSNAPAYHGTRRALALRTYLMALHTYLYHAAQFCTPCGKVPFACVLWVHIVSLHFLLFGRQGQGQQGGGKALGSGGAAFAQHHICHKDALMQAHPRGAIPPANAHPPELVVAQHKSHSACMPSRMCLSY